MEAKSVNNILTTLSTNSGKDVGVQENKAKVNEANNLFLNLLEVAKLETQKSTGVPKDFNEDSLSKKSFQDLLQGSPKANIQAETLKTNGQNNPSLGHDLDFGELNSGVLGRNKILNSKTQGLNSPDSILTNISDMAKDKSSQLQALGNQSADENQKQNLNLNQNLNQNQNRNLVSRFLKGNDSTDRIINSKTSTPQMQSTRSSSSRPVPISGITGNNFAKIGETPLLRDQVESIKPEVVNAAHRFNKGAGPGNLNRSQVEQAELLSHPELKRVAQSRKNQVSGDLVTKYSDEQNLLNSNMVKNRSPFFVSNKPIINSSSVVQSKNSATLGKENNTAILEDQSNVLDFRSNAAHLPRVNNPSGLGVTGDKSTTRIFDMRAMDSSDSVKIVSKIIDYLEQANIKNNPSLDLAVRHNDLGQFRIHVNKTGLGASDKLNMEIITNTNEGQTFFVKNERQLAQGLLESGIRIAQFKITPQAEFSRFDGESRNSNTFDLEQSDRGKQFAGNGNNRGSEDSDSRRRRELWETYKERYGT